MPRRVLLLRPDHVGDVLLSAPAVALLRAGMPHAEITYLVGPWAREAAEHGPRVDRVRTLAYPGFTRAANVHVLAPYALLVREALKLRRKRFDLAVVLRPDHWWGALLCLVAGIPVRVGAMTPETAPILTHTVRVGANEHWAAQARALAKLALDITEDKHRIDDDTDVGGPGDGEATLFRVSDLARSEAAALWARYALDGRRVVAIQPTAGALLKSWPISNWARVADCLAADGYAVVLTGAPEDGGLLTRIGAQTRQQPAALLSGQSLQDSAAIFERCALVIGLDGGAAHLAAAVGTPTVRLYGPASTEIYAPFPERADQLVLSANLACVPCGHLEAPPCGARTLPACLLAISVDDVVKLARGQLSPG